GRNALALRLAGPGDRLQRQRPDRPRRRPQRQHPREQGIHVRPTKRENSSMSKGFFTDTSLCIGCKACEVACKQWNGLPSDGYEWSGFSYDNTRQLSGTTWRHVAFIEKPGAGAPGAQQHWLMSSDVCKHCAHAGCLEAC